MSLTWKDFAATLLVILISGYTYALMRGINIPYISGYRTASLLLLLIGMVMCGLSSYIPGASSGFWTIVSMVLGVSALIFGLLGVITGSQIVFLILTGIIIVLWLITTVKHIFS